MSTNKSNKPELRFKGFSDDWEQRKLSEITTIHARIGWQNLRTSEFLDDGDYYLITGTDIVEGRIDFSNCHYVAKGRYDQDKNIQINNGSILITKDGTLGKVAYVSGLNKPATLNAGVFNVVIKADDIDGTYLYHYIDGPFLMDYVSKRATGGTIKHLNQSILVDFPVVLPSYEEQKKIGETLQGLDSLITLHQRKCDNLKIIKKSMLDNLFPKNGEKVPKWRFKGFNNDWEQRKLGELLSFLKDGTHGTHADVDDGPLLLSAKNIKNGGIYWDETDRRISYGEYEKIHSNFSLESGDVLLTIVGSIGETAILKDSEGITFQRSVAFLRPNNKITPDFLYSEIQTPIFQKELDSRKSTSAQPGIYLGDLAEIPLIFSTKIDEQKKIGEYFSNLDHLITLHQSEVERLKKAKQFFLDKMFI